MAHTHKTAGPARNIQHKQTIYWSNKQVLNNEYLRTYVITMIRSMIVICDLNQVVGFNKPIIYYR